MVEEKDSRKGAQTGFRRQQARLFEIQNVDFKLFILYFKVLWEKRITVLWMASAEGWAML